LRLVIALYSVHGPTLDQSLQAMVQRLTGGKLDGCALFFESTVDRSHAPRGNASMHALRPLFGTRSVPGCIPTQSVGTIR